MTEGELFHQRSVSPLLICQFPRLDNDLLYIAVANIQNIPKTLAAMPDLSALPWRCRHLPDDVLVTFICTPTLWFYVTVGQVGDADGHNSFPLGYPRCPTMPSGTGPPAR